MPVSLDKISLAGYAQVPHKEIFIEFTWRERKKTLEVIDFLFSYNLSKMGVFLLFPANYKLKY